MTSGIPDLSRSQRSLAAIVLTDAVDFSAHMSADEEHTLSLIQHDLHLIEKLCQSFEGRVIKSTGDGLLMCFTSAVQAVSCSLEIQRELRKAHQGSDPNQQLLHRIGIHLGDVFFSGGDVMGNGVNIAARLQTEAYPGGICISQVVHDVVRSRLSLDATYAGALHLKNIQEPQSAYHLNPYEKHESPVAPANITATHLPEQTVVSQGQKLGPGSKVGGRYTIQRVLGQGGFGRSYLVEDTQRFGELCVLKEFFPSNTSKKNLQKALDLFKREAKTLYQINHPQIPTFLACFAQEGRLFIVQEYIEGVTYSQLLRSRRLDGQRFSESEVMQWLLHMLQVLDYIHKLGIVHRDISPDNIIYAQARDLPVLIDFGLVNDAMTDILSDHGEEVTNPKSATIAGKFGYSPPEQIRLGQCFPSSDLYALGVTAIVLLTGKDPRDLLDRQSLEWQWQREVQMSGAAVDILNKLLQPKPSDRFQSAQAVLDHVVPLLSEGQATSPLPEWQQPTRIDLSAANQAAPQVSGPLQPGPPPAILANAPFIDQCRQALTRCIGPMATLVLEDVVEQNPNADPETFVRNLATHITDPHQAQGFIHTIRLPHQPPSGPVSGPTSGSARGDRSALGRSGPGGTTSFQGGATLAGNAAATPAPISPAFLQRCRQTLATYVGPMAEFLLEETLTDYPHLDAQALVAQLAAEIPDPTQAQAFQQRMQ
ncbi:MAG: protein kinase [Leptolyngbya sp.]|nr:protein kinase [Leptolyngbya sp.]